MKDLREIINEVSKEKGFVSWKDCLRSTDFGQLDNVVMIAMSRYADEKTKEFQEENQSLRDQLDSLKLRLEDAEANEEVSDQQAQKLKERVKHLESSERDWALIVKRLKAKNKKRKKQIKLIKTILE